MIVKTIEDSPQLSLPADIEHLDHAHMLFEHYLFEEDFESELRQSWLLAFNEAVSNALSHSKSHTVRIYWKRSPESLILQVADEGSGPEGALLENPRLPSDPYATSGRGLYLISQFADIWTHSKSPSGYAQTILKRFS